MRSLLFVLSAVFVMGLAYWAYQENYRTQQALREVETLQNAIAGSRETLGILRAEWAYLNRPDRLRELVILNYERLGLLPLSAHQFGQVDQVSFPEDLISVIEPIDLAAGTEGQE